MACKFIGQTYILLLVICYRFFNSTLCNDQKLFDLILDLAQRNYNNIFIVGDFNYCTIDWNLRGDKISFRKCYLFYDHN